MCIASLLEFAAGKQLGIHGQFVPAWSGDICEMENVWMEVGLALFAQHVLLYLLSDLVMPCQKHVEEELKVSHSCAQQQEWLWLLRRGYVIEHWPVLEKAGLLDADGMRSCLLPEMCCGC